MRRDWHARCGLVALALLLLLSGLHSIAGYTHGGIAPSGHAWGSDDAYISYRYARNLVAGNGLVFNPGERVEGYSNFLYVLLMAAVFLVTDRHAYGCALLLNLVCIAVVFMLFWRSTSDRLGHPRGCIAALLFALCPPVWLWVGSGMETPLVLLLTVAMWILAEDVVRQGPTADLRWLCLVIGLSVLLRADGLVPAAITTGYLALQRRWRAAAWCGATLLVVTGPYEVWRYGYYGNLLPNTYYAKVSGLLLVRVQSAIVQLSRIGWYQGFLPYYVALALGARRVVGLVYRPDSAAPEFPSFFAAGWLVYWLYIGGDHFDERFLLILCPLAIFEALRLFDAPHWRRLLPIGVAVLLLMPLRCFVADARYHYTRHKYDLWIGLGTFLGEHHAGETLAIDAAGKVPFFSHLQTLDMLGLNDAFIAHAPVVAFNPGHSKFDAAYVLSRRPDLIAAWTYLGTDLGWGLTRALYSGAGYRLRYLVNANAEAARGVAGDIVDVAGWNDEQVLALIQRGYRYAVLDRSVTRTTTPPEAGAPAMPGRPPR